MSNHLRNGILIAIRCRTACAKLCQISNVSRTSAGSQACDQHFRALGGIRTPNLLIRSQMLYPLGYERRAQRF
jgi:hypothetical protein